jgi:hypothetical protein
VSEVPAIILEVQAPNHADSRVDLKTFEIGNEVERRRVVRFAEAPWRGSWRRRPGR